MLDSQEDNTYQKVVGEFIYYASAVDTTIMVKLNSITEEYTNTNQATTRMVVHKFNYYTTYS